MRQLWCSCKDQYGYVELVPVVPLSSAQQAWTISVSERAVRQHMHGRSHDFAGASETLCYCEESGRHHLRVPLALDGDLRVHPMNWPRAHALCL